MLAYDTFPTQILSFDLICAAGYFAVETDSETSINKKARLDLRRRQLQLS